MHRRRAPKGGEAREVFNLIEQARCEALGARRMLGVAENLDFVLSEKCRNKGLADVKRMDAAMLPDALSLLVREALTGQPLPAEAQPLMDVWRDWLTEQIGDTVQQLPQIMNSQEDFSAATSQLIEMLDLLGESDGTTDDSDDNAEQEDDGDDKENGETQASESDEGGDLAADGMSGETEEDAEAAMAADDEELMGPGQHCRQDRLPRVYHRI
jgi:cobaltochelatase CobT